MRYDNKDKLHEAKNCKKKVIKNIALGLAFVTTSVISVYAGNVLTAKGILPITTDRKIQQSLEGINNVSEFSKLFSMRELLYRWYDGNIDDNALVEGAMKGMVASLKDPYTYYMNSEEYSDFKEKSEGNYMGVGIQVGIKDNKITVVSPIEGSPADKAGVLSGDVILAVNDVPVNGEELNKAVSMMKGKTKDEVKLTLFRDGKGKFDLPVKRDVVKMINVKGQMIENGIGYIQVMGFDEGTAKAFNAKLKELLDSGMNGLVLDLRGNPGGFMKECVDLVSNFVPKDKTIVSTIDKYGNEEKNVSKGGMAQGLPLIVLTDKGTASAAEIVAGAIRDYNLGTLVGTTTFGKGVVQVVLDNKEDGTALKVTISKYYTPNGENIHKTGIKPHVEIEYPKELTDKQYNRAQDPQFNKALEVLKDKMN